MSGRGSVLSRVQRGLEKLYRVETQLDVDAFVVDDRARGHALSDAAPGGAEARRPREQLLVRQDGEELSLALYVAPETLANLERHDPAQGLDERNFNDFCLAVEGVSHFIYVATCAAKDRPVTALELELQAEVDKFASCVLLPESPPRATADLRARLFERIALHEDLGPEERGRYQTANDQARRYAGALEQRYLQHGRIGEMLSELRRFWRFALRDKMGMIARGPH